MSKVTVIIPARKELYIRETVKDIYKNASDEIEVLLVIDGEKPKYRLPRRKGLKVLHNKTVKGVRECTNEAARVAAGKYIMKLDAHCSIGEGWDEILKADCPDNCIVIPRRYWWDAPNWRIWDMNKDPVDAMSYHYPFIRPYRPRLTSRPDRARMIRQADEDISEEMGFQGSCWFMTLDHYWKRLGGKDGHGYGTFAEEPEELGFKTWLGPWGGKVLRNKKTWYAHWSKPGVHWRTDPEEAGRVSDREREDGYRYCFDYWWNNRWEDKAHDFDWLIDKFWPLPKWPENWRWMVTQYNRYKMSDLWQ